MNMYTHTLIVDGQWGTWSSWSTCKVSCGGGIRLRFRDCTNPYPANGGMDCDSTSMEVDECNTDPCDSGEYMVDINVHIH